MESHWIILPKIDKSISKKLSNYPFLVRQILFNRGIKSKNKAKNFLDKSFYEFYDPFKIYQMKKAANLVLDYVEKGKKIYIHGDFDVDGICATSILFDFLYRELKANVMPYIPSRFNEGYGISDESLGNIKKGGGELVITVDCGIRDNTLVKKWCKKGLDFIITDHHELKRDKKAGKVILPGEALAVVHPQHPKGRYPFKDISGATVVWKLIAAIAETKKIKLNIEEYLDLVGLSVVCDIMPLVDENRSMLKKSFEAIKETKRVGLMRLINDAGIDISRINSYHLGFIIGPRLNAVGRLDHAIDAVRLLVTKSNNKARDLSEKLNLLNQRRQSIQREIYNKAVEQIKKAGIEKKLYFVWGEDWAEGVIGIVAGKISEKFHRPVLIATKCKGEYKGSARSIERFNIIKAINLQSDILERFGGHPQAAGFTVKHENIEQFRDDLLEIADGELDEDDIRKEELVDCEIKINDVSFDLLEWVEKFAPFGYGNKKPRFVIRDLEISSVDLVGSDSSHLKFSFLNKDTGEFISAIGFRLGEKFPHLKAGDMIDILFTIELNEWNGSSTLQLNVTDLKVVE